MCNPSQDRPLWLIRSQLYIFYSKMAQKAYPDLFSYPIFNVNNLKYKCYLLGHSLPLHFSCKSQSSSAATNLILCPSPSYNLVILLDFLGLLNLKPLGSYRLSVQRVTENHTKDSALLYAELWTRSVLFGRAIQQIAC